MQQWNAHWKSVQRRIWYPKLCLRLSETWQLTRWKASPERDMPSENQTQPITVSHPRWRNWKAMRGMTRKNAMLRTRTSDEKWFLTLVSNKTYLRSERKVSEIVLRILLSSLTALDFSGFKSLTCSDVSNKLSAEGQRLHSFQFWAFRPLLTNQITLRRVCFEKPLYS